MNAEGSAAATGRLAAELSLSEFVFVAAVDECFDLVHDVAAEWDESESPGVLLDLSDGAESGERHRVGCVRPKPCTA